MTPELFLFTASWCQVCPMLKANLDKRGIEYTLVDIETEEGEALAAHYRVRGLPSLGMEGKVIGTGAEAYKTLGV